MTRAGREATRFRGETVILAATFHGVERVAVVEKPEPEILEPTDALVEVQLAGLCGSDLHPYLGREKGIDAGTTMGHEFTGAVVEVGEQVRRIRAGDVVVSPFSTSCGACGSCRRSLSSRCRRGALFGWVEKGRGLDGAQAQRIRVPLADSTLVPRPADLSPLEGLLLGDVVSTGFFVTERAGVGRHSTVAVVGLGAVGLSAVLAAVSLGAEVVLGFDSVGERLELAGSFGATPVCIRGGDGKLLDDTALAAEGRRLCGGEGVDAVIEAVGSPAAARLAVELLRPGGYLSIAGVHTAESFPVSPGVAYDKNLTLAIGRCPVRSRLDALLVRQLAERLPIERLVTHRVPIDAAADAYRMFAARSAGCIKVVFET